MVCAHVASVCRTAEAVRDISRAIFSTTPTCARYNLYLVVVILTYLAQLTKQPVHTGSYQLLSFGFRRVLANEEDLASRAPSTTSSTKSSYLQVQKTHPSITFYIETQKKSTKSSASTWSVTGTPLVLTTTPSFHFFFHLHISKLKLLLFCVCV